jgi:hypothetical protein
VRTRRDFTKIKNFNKYGNIQSAFGMDTLRKKKEFLNKTTIL